MTVTWVLAYIGAAAVAAGRVPQFYPGAVTAGAEAGLLPAGGAQHLRGREHARLPDGL